MHVSLRAAYGTLLVTLLAASPASAQPLIVVDPGHGGTDPGAIGCGLHEADVNLDTSLRFRDLLVAAGLRARMTRDTDVFVSLDGRTSFANSLGADRFVAIHSNSFSDPTANGTETFSVPSPSATTRDMRDRIQRAMLAAWGLRDRGVKEYNFYVLVHTAMPATLSEMGFVSNCTRDATFLGSPTHRQEAAQAHLDAIVGHLGWTVTPSTGTLAGVVYADTGAGPEDTSMRIAGATVMVEGGASATADAMGAFTFELPVGSATLGASADGYPSASVTCEVVAGTESRCDIGLRADVVEVDGGSVSNADAGMTTRSDSGVSERAPDAGGMTLSSGCSITSAQGRATHGWLGLAIAIAVVWRRRRRSALGRGAARWRGHGRRRRARARAAMTAIAVLMTSAIAACTGTSPHTGRSSARALGDRDRVVTATVVSPFARVASERRVTADNALAAPVLSPRGDWVAVTSDPYVGLSIVRVEDGLTRTLSSAPRAGYLPVWRADSEAIAFRVPGQSPTAVPIEARALDGTKIAPFGGRMARRVEQESDRIVLVDDGTRLVVSPSAERGKEPFFEPKLSPDGRFVVYVGLYTGLYVYAIESGLTFALGPGAHAMFAPGGRWLVFDRAQDDGEQIVASDLFIADLASGAVVVAPVTSSTDRIERFPSVSTAADRIAFEVDGRVVVAELVTDR